MQFKTQQFGFTLIEMLVSLALFTIVAVIAVGTLLSLIGNNTQAVGDQQVMTGMSFALDSMTREIRTGSEYYCNNATNVRTIPLPNPATDVRDCTGSTGEGFSFREAGDSITGGASDNRIYYYRYGTKLMRRVGSNPEESVLSDDIVVTYVHFIVTGSFPYSVGTNIQQPMVTIVMDAKAASSSNAKPFTIQTTVTQRPLDL